MPHDGTTARALRPKLERLSPVLSIFQSYAAAVRNGDATIIAVLEFAATHSAAQLDSICTQLLRTWPVLSAAVLRSARSWVYDLRNALPSSFVRVTTCVEPLADGISATVASLGSNAFPAEVREPVCQPQHACASALSRAEVQVPPFDLTQVACPADGSSALLVRVSHTVADGEAMLQLLHEIAAPHAASVAALGSNGARGLLWLVTLVRHTQWS